MRLWSRRVKGSLIFSTSVEHSLSLSGYISSRLFSLPLCCIYYFPLSLPYILSSVLYVSLLFMSPFTLLCCFAIGCHVCSPSVYSASPPHLSCPRPLTLHWPVVSRISFHFYFLYTCLFCSYLIIYWNAFYIYAFVNGVNFGYIFTLYLFWSVDLLDVNHLLLS